jgi:hypothetical protein
LTVCLNSETSVTSNKMVTVAPGHRRCWHDWPASSPKASESTSHTEWSKWHTAWATRTTEQADAWGEATMAREPCLELRVDVACGSWFSLSRALPRFASL